MYLSKVEILELIDDELTIKQYDRHACDDWSQEVQDLKDELKRREERDNE
tara:strand:+ start:686 stop:835 length:150 start_codon:yes stop_codon:yes gene_type:complete